MIETKTIELTRVKNDSNGNPRYVVHFLDLLSERDKEYIQSQYEKNRDWAPIDWVINQEIDLALRKAKLIGGSKYRGKDFGGGIVFQSYNTGDLVKDLYRFQSDKEELDWSVSKPMCKDKRRFTQSKDNLCHDGQGNVFSYDSFVAQRVGEYLVVADKFNSYSVTTSKHISIAAYELGLKRITEFEYHNRY